MNSVRVPLNLEELAMLRLWLDEGRTQTYETNENNEEALEEFDRLDRKLQRAVNRWHMVRSADIEAGENHDR